jgi:hypothetical protein
MRFAFYIVKLLFCKSMFEWILLFDNVSAVDFTQERLAIVKLLRNKYRAIIENEHQGK